MNVFIKAISCILVALILYLVLMREGKDYSILLSILVCSLVIFASLKYLDPVFDFAKRLQTTWEIDQAYFTIILKSVGIGLLAEIVGLICADAGNAAFSKSLHILATSAILWLSIPLFEGLLDLIGEVLGGI